MNRYKQLKNSRISRVAEMVTAFLLEQVNSATGPEQIELYKACYDFLDDPEFRSGELDRLCRIDPRPRDENGDIIDTED